MFFCVFRLMFYRFLEGRNLKNINFASTGALFSQNQHFQKSVKKHKFWFHFGRPKPSKITLKSGQVRSRHFRSKKGRTGTFRSQFSRRQGDHPPYKEGSALENSSISYVCHYLGTFKSKMGWIVSKMCGFYPLRLELGSWALLCRSWGALGCSWSALGPS